MFATCIVSVDDVRNRAKTFCTIINIAAVSY